MTDRKTHARILRIFRKLHRRIGAVLFIFFIFVSITSILLGWKKHSNGLILSESKRGTSTNLEEWLPVDSLHIKACKILRDSVSADLSPEINRIDIRKNKGMVKFVFENHYYEIQLDGATGRLLQIAKRRSDFIENIHDGSVLDTYLGTPGSVMKLTYTTVMGLALLIFTITGFWLWYGPKIMRRKRRKS